MSKWFIGVDEAGRGPLAGPVAVGAVKVAKNFDLKKHFPDAADSKVLSAQKREEIYARMQAFAKKGKLEFAVVLGSASTIDSRGISKVVRQLVYKGVRRLSPEAKGVEVLLDGLLHAPEEYAQQTIIKGDATVAVISLASIAAKVHRDRLMRAYDKKYPQYGFAVHKGYGTAQHRKNITKHGLSKLHRASFCKGIRMGKKVNNSFDHIIEAGV